MRRSTSGDQLAFQTNVGHKHTICFCATNLLILYLGTQNSEYWISITFFLVVLKKIQLHLHHQKQNKQPIVLTLIICLLLRRKKAIKTISIDLFY